MPTDALEEVRGEVTTAIRMALAVSATKLCTGLTGGKDTRLILAILLAEGLASEVEFQTFGQPDLPDVVVAQQIAEAFGLHHVLNPGVGDLWAWKQTRDADLREAGHDGVLVPRSGAADHRLGGLRLAERGRPAHGASPTS